MPPSWGGGLFFAVSCLVVLVFLSLEERLRAAFAGLTSLLWVSVVKGGGVLKGCVRGSKRNAFLLSLLPFSEKRSARLSTWRSIPIPI